MPRKKTPTKKKTATSNRCRKTKPEKKLTESSKPTSASASSSSIRQASIESSAHSSPLLSDDELAALFDFKRLRALTRAKQQAFLIAFCKTACVTRAAKLAGISRKTVYNWLRNNADTAFSDMFEEAREVACDELEHAVRRRAIVGEPRLKFYKGEPIIDPRTGDYYVEHEYSDRLLLALLRAHRPEKYSERIQAEVSQKSESVDDNTPAEDYLRAMQLKVKRDLDLQQ